MTTVRYEVQDLVRPRNPGADATICLADLAENVKNVTDPDYWNGEGTAMRLDEEGSITITANSSMQAKVALVLQDMRRVLAHR